MRFLSDEARDQCYSDIGRALPPPVVNTEEQRRCRTCTAIEAFNDLQPANAYEAHLAVTIVLCSAHAVDSLREAGVYQDDFVKMTRCRAQAASMLREARAAKRILVQEQKHWAMLEVAADAARTRLASSAPPQPAFRTAPPAAPATAPPVPASAPPVPASAPEPAPAPEQSPVPPLHLVATEASPPRTQAEAAPAPSLEAITRAEAFVHDNILAAAQIRHERGISPQCKAAFGRALPADAAVIDALVRGRSDLLVALDGLHDELLDAAA